jgi:hypothetical protein
LAETNPVVAAGGTTTGAGAAGSLSATAKTAPDTATVAPAPQPKRARRLIPTLAANAASAGLGITMAATGAATNGTRKPRATATKLPAAGRSRRAKATN